MRASVAVFAGVFAGFLRSPAVATPPDAPIPAATMQRALGKGFDVRWAEFPTDIASYSAQKPATAAAHGFTNARIRVDSDLSDPTFAAHLDTVIRDTLAAGLTPLLAKKGEALKADPSSASALEGYVRWWGAAAARYQNATHKLIFDLMVEPADALGSDLPTLNKAYLQATTAIRQSNPTRLISFAPGHIASADYLPQLEIPPAARPYAIAEFHTYAAGPNPDPSSKKYWTGNGTAAQRKYFTEEVAAAIKWQGSSVGLPTWFGAWMTSDFNKGSHYTVAEQCAFSTFVCATLAESKIPWSINTYSIFFGEGETPVSTLLPVLNVLQNCSSSVLAI